MKYSIQLGITEHVWNGEMPYEDDDNMGSIYLRGDSFTEFMSKYCGAK